MDNRFSTMTEVRRVEWPRFETPQYADPLMYEQGIARSLRAIFFGIGPSSNSSSARPRDIRLLCTSGSIRRRSNYHSMSGYSQTRIRCWYGVWIIWSRSRKPRLRKLKRFDSFLTARGLASILGPHHDVGASDDLAVRAMEYAHHGDALVPRQQRFGKYTRSLMSGLDMPVENRYGLLPAREPETKQIAPLSIVRDLNTRGLLNGVTTFNFHRHLPHYALTTEAAEIIHVLARQPIDLSNPHPFTEAGNREFNMLIWMPPSDSPAGDVLLADSTIFSTLFGVSESLENFWRNLAKM